MTTYNLFPGTPALAADPDATAVSLGTEFYSSATGWVTQIRFLQPISGFRNELRTCAIYSTVTGTTGTMVAGPFTMPAAVAGTWCTYTLATAFQMTAGVRYRVVIHHPYGKYAATGRYFDTGAGSTTTTQGIFTVPNLQNAAGVKQGSYFYAASIGFPGAQYQGGAYYSDATVTDVNPAGGSVSSGATSLQVTLTGVAVTRSVRTGSTGVQVNLTATATQNANTTTAALAATVQLSGSAVTRVVATTSTGVQVTLTGTAAQNEIAAGSIRVAVFPLTALTPTTGNTSVQVDLTGTASSVRVGAGATTISVAVTAAAATRTATTGVSGVQVVLAGAATTAVQAAGVTPVTVAVTAVAVTRKSTSGALATGLMLTGAGSTKTVTTGLAGISAALTATALMRVTTTGAVNLALSMSSSVTTVARTGGELMVGLVLSGAASVALKSTGTSVVSIELSGVGVGAANLLQGWYSTGTQIRTGTLVYWNGTETIPITSVIESGGASG